MGLASISCTNLSYKMVLDSLPLIPQSRTSYILCFNMKTYFRNIPRKAYISPVTDSPLLHKGLVQGSFSSRHTGSSIVALGAKNSRSGEEDNRALETVLKLYKAIRNRNISELSKVIGKECRGVCNFISMFQSFHGKNQVLYFFSTLMKYLGNNIEFVVQPTSHDGMNVGVAWRLECGKTHVPLGKGFSFYMCHIYQGKVLIRNVEMFMEPLFHIEPLRLKMIGFVMIVIDKIGFHAVFKGEMKRAIYILLTISLMTALLFFVKLFLY